MIMTDEQFKNEIFHRRDEAIKRRKARKRVALSVVPVVCVLVVAVFLLELIQPFDKSAVSEDGTVGVAVAKNTITLSDGTEKELETEAVEWLIENATADVSAGNSAVGQVGLPDKSADEDDADDLKSEDIVISFTYQGQTRKLILNEHGLYSENTGKCIMPRSDRLMEFIKMIE